ncbi:hypothetical protein GCM10025857_15180 [Alicyclobacillus contaminans]|nr:hypothetical protein GCM10025857_15180 [Alicyclobacillus contaminans]
MAVNENKVRRMDFTRTELVRILGALEAAYESCPRTECEVGHEYKAIAGRIEKSCRGVWWWTR